MNKVTKYAITCQNCNNQYVESAHNLWFIYGFLIFSRYGVKTVVGCKICVQKNIRRQLLLNSLFGWWCFPWGLGTPFVIVQNIFEYFRPQNKVLLEEKIAESGYNPDELILDSDDLTRSEKKIIKITYSIFAYTISLLKNDVKNSEEEANKMLNRIFDDKITKRFNVRNFEVTIREKMFADLSQELKENLLINCLNIIFHNGKVDSDKIDIFYKVAFIMNIDQSIAKNILEYIFNTPDSEKSQDSEIDFNKACEILNLSTKPDVNEVKSAFRVLMLKYHPDRAGDSQQRKSEYTKKAQEINWAYQYLSKYLETK